MRFIVDNTLGRLRRWMSLLGYDVVYDPRSAREILREPPPGRGADTVVLGRCPSLAEDRGDASEAASERLRFCNVPSPELRWQLRQITRDFPLDFARTAFTRCSHCNVPLNGPMPIESVANVDDPERGIPAMVREWRRRYWQCPACGRAYWQGTHLGRIRRSIEEWTGVHLPPLPENGEAAKS